jgi:pilus assembly protein Flp/PilA
MESKSDRRENPEERKPGPGILAYILVLIVVAVVLIVVLALLGPTTGNIFSRLPSNI